MREISENWTFLKIGSRRASGKILSMSLQLLFCPCVSFHHLVHVKEVAYLRIDRGEVGQAGLAINGVCKLFLWWQLGREQGGWKCSEVAYSVVELEAGIVLVSRARMRTTTGHTVRDRIHSL